MQSDRVVLKPHLLMQGIFIIISIIIILLAGLLLLFPPIGLILGILLFVVVVVLNIHLMSLRIFIHDDILIKQSLFTATRIDLHKFEKFDKMKIIGTVSNSPFAIRNIQLKVAGEVKEINTLIFRWQEVLDLLDLIQKEYEDDNENTDSGH